MVKLGHDPRKDPQSRFYQTLMFRLVPGATMQDANGADADGTGRIPRTKPGSVATSHLFTGHPPIYTDAKSWMVCDVLDPFLTTHIFNAPARPTCDIATSGWYGNVQLALGRAIMRAKIQFMMDYPDAKEFPREWEEEMRPLFTALPVHVQGEEEIGGLVVGDNQRCLGLCSEIRGTLRGGPGRVGYGRRVGGEVGEGDGDGEGKRVRWEDGGEEEESESEISEGEDEGEENRGEEDEGQEREFGTNPQLDFGDRNQE